MLNIVLIQVFIICTLCLATSFGAEINIDSVIYSAVKSDEISRADLVKLIVYLSENMKVLEDKVAAVPQLRENVKALQKEVMVKNTKIEELEREVQKLMEGTRGGSSGRQGVNTFHWSSKRQLDVQSTAFSTVLENDARHLGDKQPIKFDKILLNDGNAYEPNTGVFTAPVAGTYIFMYSLGHHGTGETWLELVKNGDKQNGVAVEGHFSSQNLQGSNSAILRLAANDMVWVEAWQVHDTSAQNTFTTFSGALLFE